MPQPISDARISHFSRLVGYSRYFQFRLTHSRDGRRLRRPRADFEMSDASRHRPRLDKFDALYSISLRAKRYFTLVEVPLI